MAEINSHDLLAYAADLVQSTEGRGRPAELSLRRATVASYYAVFHELTLQTSRHLLGASNDAAAAAMRRKVSHAGLAGVCDSISKGTNQHKVMAEVFSVCCANQDLRRQCAVFCDLQEQRHAADYDHLIRPTKAATQTSLASARNAVDFFRSELGGPCRPAFYTALSKEFKY